MPACLLLQDHAEVDVPSYVELLKINPDAPSGRNGGQTPDGQEMNFKDLPSLPAVTSQTSTLTQIDRKKKVVPIAPAPPSVQYNFSVIVLKGGLALIFAYPTSGVGQVVPLACVKLGEGGDEREPSAHSLLQGGNLSATVARLLASNQIPTSAKQLLLQSLSTVVPQLHQQVGERPGPSEKASSSQDATNVPWNAALSPDMANLLQSVSRDPAPLSTKPHTTAHPTLPPAHHLQAMPATTSGNPTLSDLLKLTQSLSSNSDQVVRTHSSPAPSTAMSRGMSSTSMDYDPQAFSQFARDLSRSMVDPLKPTLDSKGKQRRGRKLGHSHSCPVSPSPATTWAPAASRPSGRLPTNGAGALAALLTPFASFPGPTPLAPLGALPTTSAPTNSATVASGLTSAPVTKGAHESSSHQPNSTLQHQNGRAGPHLAPADRLAFLEEMDWATLERGLPSGTTTSGTTTGGTTTSGTTTSGEHSSSSQERSTSHDSCVPPSHHSQATTDRQHTAVPTTGSHGQHIHYQIPVGGGGNEGPAPTSNHSNGHLQGNEIHTLTEANPARMHTSPTPNSNVSSNTSCASMDYSDHAFTPHPSTTSAADSLNPPFDSSLDSLLSSLLGDSGFMSSILEDTHLPPAKREGQAHAETLTSAPSLSQTNHLLSSHSLTLQQNGEHDAGSSPAHPVSPAHLMEAVTSPVDRMLHDILNMTSPRQEGTSAPYLGISPVHGSNGTSPMLPLISSSHSSNHSSHNPGTHSGSADNENGSSHQQVTTSIPVVHAASAVGLPCMLVAWSTPSSPTPLCTAVHYSLSFIFSWSRWWCSLKGFPPTGLTRQHSQPMTQLSCFPSHKAAAAAVSLPAVTLVLWTLPPFTFLKHPSHSELSLHHSWRPTVSRHKTSPTSPPHPNRHSHVLVTFTQWSLTPCTTIPASHKPPFQQGLH